MTRVERGSRQEGVEVLAYGKGGYCFVVSSKEVVQLSAKTVKVLVRPAFN